MKSLPAIVLVLVITTAPALSQNLIIGQEIYFDQCASCHGQGGEGQGPLAPTLTLQPKDLTMLRQNNSGEFPTLQVVRRIDGRDPLVSHGSPMPIFGDFFDGRRSILKTENGQPILTSQPIIDLIGWLEAIQK